MNTCNISPTLRAQTHGHPPCICFDKKDISIDKTPDAILGENFKDNNCVCYTKKSFGMYEQGVGTLRAAGGDAGGGQRMSDCKQKEQLTTSYSFKPFAGADAGSIGFTKETSVTLTQTMGGVLIVKENDKKCFNQLSQSGIYKEDDVSVTISVCGGSNGGGTECLVVTKSK